MESWVFLLVGGLGATGAALSLGTLAALVRYERTGEVPGLDEDSDDEVVAPSGSAVRRRLLVRIVIGAVVAAVCFVYLADQGLLGGPVLG